MTIDENRMELAYMAANITIMTIVTASHCDTVHCNTPTAKSCTSSKILDAPQRSKDWGKNSRHDDLANRDLMRCEAHLM